MPRDLVCPYIYLELSCYQRGTARLALVQDPCKYFINMRTAESMDKINKIPISYFSKSDLVGLNDERVSVSKGSSK